MELHRERRQLRLWGGLVGKPQQRRDLQQRYGDLAAVWYGYGRVGFRKYFRQLQQSLVVLTPSGNAPWSYRHYEVIYSGALIVSNDMSKYKTLIPLPTHNI